MQATNQSSSEENTPIIDNTIHRLLEDARKRLVETGTRNRLINVNRKASRANVLNIVNEKSDEIFYILYKQSKKMRFLALKKDAEDNEQSDSPSFEDFDAEGEFDESRFTDNNLETMLTNDGLQKRLLRLAKEAETAEQEQGINILYLALGFLKWFEEKSSSVERNAPLILMPVSLVRNAKTATYDIEIRDDEIVANLPLQERLKEEFGIVLPEIVIEDNWTPTSYFQQLSQQIEQFDKWEIDMDGMQLGFFSFAKLLMLRDLDPKNWSNGALTGNNLINGLLKDGFESEPPLYGPEESLDEKLSPADIVQIVDADSSQTKVIEEVRSGRNLVVQGPPGTGKSQTITNIIASAVHDGKTVLFMAEKMAALSVVEDKLRKNGLADVTLELHSRKANKKTVKESIESSLAASQNALSVPDNSSELKQVRDTLNLCSAMLHEPIKKTGETPFSLISVQARLIGENVTPPTTKSVALQNMTRGEALELSEKIDDYYRLTQRVGSLSETPLSMVSNLELQPTDLERAELKSPNVTKAFISLSNQLNELQRKLGLKKPKTLSSCKDLNKSLNLIPEPPSELHELQHWLLATENSKRLTEALSLNIDCVKKLDAVKNVFIEDSWHVKLSHHRATIIQGTRSFWSRWGSKYRNASNEISGVLKSEIPKKADERLALLDSFVETQIAIRKAEEERSFLENLLGDGWRSYRTPFKNYLNVLTWWSDVSNLLDNNDKQTVITSFVDGFDARQAHQELSSKISDLESLFGELNSILELTPSKSLKKGHKPLDIEEEELTVVASKLTELKEQLSANYEDWRRMKRILNQFDEVQLVSLLNMIDQGSDALAVQKELIFARAETIWKSIQSHELRDLVAKDRHQLVKQFQSLEAERLTQTRKQILAKYYQQVPQGAAGGMSVIKSEIGKKQKLKPIRKLMAEAGETLQRIKPVFLMSPISIAQFLPPEKLTFDLLVIDEASQVRPEDALGAVARAKQIVVVGDHKQMPPSSFFDKLTSNEEDDEDDMGLGGAAKATELESILTLCQARGLGGLPRMLEWHYRSKDPSLISVSNIHFYENKLILPPTPLQSDSRFGLIYTYVKGVYARGVKSKNINTIEARAIIDRVKEHAKDHPTLSLGIATFSKVQQNHLTELLEYERRSDKTLDVFLREGKYEDVFVKNLENVQGDERDVILISVCYGPQEPGGRLTSMSFGPVNSEGGERRLNVLFTRARYRTEVFCSFDPADIDPNRTKQIGPKLLKEYLTYAKHGELQEAIETHLDADSDFEIDVATEIRNQGYAVEYQVGSAGFKIDLGVRDKDQPDRFILAVECDGATYHSSLWARERDRLRQGILEQHGWTFHRVWSTDWFYRREYEIERLKKALNNASSSFKSNNFTEGANKELPPPQPNERHPDKNPISDISHAFERPVAEPYEQFIKSDPINHIEPHEYAESKVVDLVISIVKHEGPIHQEEVARRYASAFSKTKAGKRIVNIVNEALVASTNRHDVKIVRDEEFYLTAERLDNMWVRSRADMSGSILKADMHSRLEIAEAARRIEELSGPVDDDELCKEIALFIGYKRVGPDLRKTLEKAIKHYRLLQTSKTTEKE